MHGSYGINDEYKQEGTEEANLVMYTKKEKDVLEANKLAAFIYFTCQGHLFMQAGEEFGRTKLGDENSYRSDPKINMMKWKQTQEFVDLVEYYTGLISLRKKLPGLYDKTAEAFKRISQKTVQDKKVVSFVVDNTSKENIGEWSQLFIVYNAGKEQTSVKLPEGEWTVLADKEETDCIKTPLYTADNKLIVEAVSGMILGKR